MKINIEVRRGQYRIKNGKAWRYAADYGEIAGTKGADGQPIDCYVGLFPQAEQAFIINQFAGGKFDEHKIMLNFFDEEQAARAYEITTGRSPEIFACSKAQLEWWLDNGNHKKLVSAQSFPYDTEQKMTPNIDWSNIDTAAAKLIYGLRSTDTYEEMLEPATMDAVMQSEIEDGAELEDEAAFDALVVQNKKLERTANLLGTALNRASSSLKVAENGVFISKPMKQNGTTNVAVMFELTDGQTVSVLLHNPDTTPQKITPDDMLISWKWLLNRKDITIAVARENGKDLPIQQVARRVMALVEKNTARFAKANAARAERVANLAKMEQEIAEKEGILADLVQQLEAKENGTQMPETSAMPSEKAEANPENDTSLEWSDNNPYRNGDDVLAQAFEQRIVPTNELMATYRALAESMGYFVNYDDAAMGTFLAKKSVGDKEVVISGAYKNSDVTEYKRNPYDYEVVFKLPNGGFVQPKKTNSLDEALAWGNEWLDEQSESSEAPADVQEASEMPSEAVAAGNDGQTATIEPVVVTGKELGDFDTDTEEGKKALRQAAFDHLKGLVGQTVYSSALKADVGFSGSGAKKYKHSSANPIKLLLAVKIKEIIANGIKFKESQESYSDKEVELGIKYHYLKTVVNVDGVSYGARVVVSEDLGGKFHYDLQVKESVDAIMDSLDVENDGIVEVHKAPFPRHLQADKPLSQNDTLDSVNTQEGVMDDTKAAEEELLQIREMLDNNRTINEAEGNIEQAALEAETVESIDELLDLANQDATFDSTNGGWVLNLFLFDKDGNEIKDEDSYDEEEADKSQENEFQTEQPAATEPQVEDDRAFLQDVIDGKIDVLADDFYAKMEEIATRVYEYDQDLVAKAVDAYALKTDEFAQESEEQ